MSFQSRVRELRERDGKLSPDILRIIVLLLVFVLVAGFVIGNSTGSDDEEAPATPPGGGAWPVHLARGVSGPTAPVVASGGGVLNEKVPTLTVVEDFRCPGCIAAERRYGDVIRDMAGKGEINLVHYPLFFLDGKSGGSGSSRAAQAALCAADTGRFTDFHKALFSRPDDSGFATKDLEEVARGIGLGQAEMTAWKQCLSEQRYRGYLDGTQKHVFDTLKVTQTPTFLINGRQIEAEGTPDEFRERVLREAR